MNTLHPIFQQALAPFAPPTLSESERMEIDMQMHFDKLVDGYGIRNQQQAQRLQDAEPRRQYD